MINRRTNNRKSTLGRKIQYAPRYSKDEIREGKTTIERLRRSRCIKNIKTN